MGYSLDFKSIRVASLLLCSALFVMALSCQSGGSTSNENQNSSDTDENGNANDNRSPQDDSGKLSGQLSILSTQERTTLLEDEPNDVPDFDSPLIAARLDQRIEVFGDVSESSADFRDGFVIATDIPLHVTVVLTFDFNPEDPAENDPALGITFSGSGTAACTLDSGHSYDLCFDTVKNPEVAEFDVDGDFGITIDLKSGSANYIMGMIFESSTGASTLSRSSRSQRFVDSDPLDRFYESELVIKFEQGTTVKRQEDILRQQGLRVVSVAPSGYCIATTQQPPDATRLAQARRTMYHLESLRAHSEIRVVEPNYRVQSSRVPDDYYYRYQWHYDLINLPDAWEMTVGSDEVIIAVVDTGILLAHPDFEGRLVDGYDLISNASVARDGDGVDPNPNDEGDLAGGPGRSSYHGTHVAGTIGAATNNGFEVAGVTWDARIMPVRALGVGGGSSFDIGEAIRFAAGISNVSGTVPEETAHIINLSIATPAGSTPSQVMGDAIAEAVAKGVVVVAAAGNDASSKVAYPAGYPGVISVAACDPQLLRSPYSNFGSSIDITAPGGNLSYDLTGDGYGDGVLSLMGDVSTGAMEFVRSFQHGTSMASPHVAGVAGLVISMDPTLAGDAEAVRQILLSTATDVSDLNSGYGMGAGVVNAARAVNEAAARAGLLQDEAPRMGLSTDLVNFGNSRDELTVQVINTGGGQLEVVDVASDEINGSGWLAFRLEESSGTTNVSAIHIQVDRILLEDGFYFGKIRVTDSESNSKIIDVTMSVGQLLAVDDVIYVTAIDAETRVTLAQGETSADFGFAFTVEDIPPGTYKIYAGTDRDNDGQICDVGELCGGFPSAILANEITIDSDSAVFDIDFAVGELIFEARASNTRSTPEHCTDCPKPILPISLLDRTPRGR